MYACQKLTRETYSGDEYMKVITDKIILKIQNTLLESVLVCNPDHP
jgi:hypothetical protein